LLIGTIGFVLVQQNQVGSVGAIAAWLVAAMVGLVFGGLIYRGGLASMLVAAAIDAGFGVALIAIEYDRLRRMLKILPASDVAAIGDALDVAGFLLIGAGALCLVALPQGIRYARWFRAAAATRSAMSTARGFPPPPVPARTATYIIPAEDQPGSRRRLYTVLGGLAVGVGAGAGVVVSSSNTGPIASAPAITARRGPPAPAAAPPGAITRPAATTPPGATTRPAATTPPPSAPGPDGSAASISAASNEAPATSAVTIQPNETVERMLSARRAALAAVDTRALADLLAPTAFGFGVDADEVAEGRDLVVAQIARDLGEPPPGGFTVESRALAVGEDRGHAWIAEELEVTAPGAGPEPRERRRFAISELAAVIDGRWKVVALHWATPVDDATAERLAILKTMPVPQALPDRADDAGGLTAAVRAAFASRAGFAAARSERVDAFNYGSGGERAKGGAGIKRIFMRLKAQFRMREGARIVTGDVWDPVQRSAPWIGWAALNVDFTSKTQATTEITQSFRVLAIFVVEGSEWRIVQTQWSNAGPIH
jgi:ketosteroid isomerase-like protein